MPEKKYNKIVCYLIARNVTDAQDTFDTKITALRDFVHRNVKPVDFIETDSGTVAIDKLTLGVGYCDQQSRVYMALARSIGITSRLAFLQLPPQSSPHTIAETLTPDDRWVIVDSTFALDLRTRDGRLAGRQDILEDPSIILTNSAVERRGLFDERWRDPAFLAIYSNKPQYIITAEGVRFDTLQWVPRVVLRPIVYAIHRIYIQKTLASVQDPYERMMIDARVKHLIGYFCQAEPLYEEILASSKNVPLVRRAEYYYALLLVDMGDFRSALEFIDRKLKGRTWNEMYNQYLLGLKADILDRLGKDREAHETLERAQNMLEI